MTQLASQRAKPAGVYVINDSDVAEVLRTTDVYKLPGCGEYSRIGEALTRNECKCIADVQQFSVQQLSELIGEKSAQQ
jgi:nucleotidyltransferase/DNA polymerase involved in DNA repair